MQKLLARLPTWLRRNSRGDALSSLIAQLTADHVDPVQRPFTLKQGGETWEGIVVEVCRPGSPETVEQLTASLLTAVPAPMEFALVTHTAPVAAEAEQNAAPGAVPVRLSALLQPLQGEQPRTVCSYLFLRTLAKTKRYDWLSAVERAATESSIPLRALTGAEVANLLQDWCEPDSAGEVERVWHSIFAVPDKNAVHAQLSWTNDCSSQVEKWECVHFQASDGREEAVHLETSVLLRGSAHAVGDAVREQERSLNGSGFRPTRRWRSTAKDGFYQIPWLRKMVKAYPSARNGLAFSGKEFARLLPLPAGAPGECRLGYRDTALRTLNHRGVVTYLHNNTFARRTNMLIMGAPGAGVTYLGNALVAAHLRGGGHAWSMHWQETPVFDEVTGAFSVAPLAPSLTQPLPLNPLYGHATDLEFFDSREVLRSWLGVIAGLSEYTNAAWRDEKHLLDSALDGAWDRVRGKLGLRHVLAELQHVSPAGRTLAETIRARLTGLPAEFGNGPSIAGTEAAHISVDASGFVNGSHMQIISASVLALFSVTTARMPRQTPKLLHIDGTMLLGERAASDLLTVVLRRMHMSNASAIFCDQPFDADPAKQTQVQRVLDESTGHKVFLYGRPHDGWLERGKRIFGNAGAFARTDLFGSRFVWLREDEGAAALLELKLSDEAQVALAPSHWQRAEYLKARSEGLDVDAALTRGTTAYSVRPKRG